MASAAPVDKTADDYFSNEEIALTPQERTGIDIEKKYDATSERDLKPVAGPDGSVRFIFGATKPRIICAVLQVCDIELQVGEQVNSINLGDTARWIVEPAITGYGDNEIQHLIIKPLDVALDTSLIVTTNRRTYHIRLRSTRNEFMSRVTFTYPDEATKKWALLKANSEKEHTRNTIPGTKEYLGDLTFNYKLDGNAPWKPVRVYNDGRKTIIEMPDAMSQTEAPTLLVMRSGGGSSDDDQVMVNYRVQGNRFIVDSIFDKAILVAGAGDTQDRVTITRGE